MDKLAKSFLFVLCIFHTSVSYALDVHIFSVGQANLVVVRHKNKALIVDCGVPQSQVVVEKRSGSLIKEFDSVSTVGTRGNVVKRLLEGFDTTIVITHQHSDHYLLLPSILDTGITNVKQIIIGGSNPTLATNQLKKMLKSGSVSTKFVNVPETLSGIKGCLGEDVCVEPILPSEWSGRDAHDQNIVIKITYAGRSLLFPGDANGRLLDRIVTVNSSVLKDIDCMLLSHHGSNDHGELEWFRQATSLTTQSKGSLLTVVSSDPEGRDALPWNTVKTLDCIFSGADYCEAHVISLRGSSEKIHCKGKKFSVDNISNHKRPLFITCNSIAKYYKLTISTGGTMTFQDGDGVPLFCSISSAIRPIDQISELLAELKKRVKDPKACNYFNWAFAKLFAIYYEHFGFRR